MHRQGFYAWFNKNLRGRKGQQGFTLIELLVVVTILGVLAAIVTLSLVGLTTNANTQACNTEYKTVQAAIDAYMANKQLDVLPGAQATYTNDMTGSAGGSIPLFVANPSAANPNYTRNGTTQFFYTWDQFGKITGLPTQTATNTGIGSDNAGKAVNGCVPK
jgi:prepilin-type N-terminal cleavage/methylation domain-containing protein